MNRFSAKVLRVLLCFMLACFLSIGAAGCAENHASCGEKATKCAAGCTKSCCERT